MSNTTQNNAVEIAAEAEASIKKLVAARKTFAAAETKYRNAKLAIYDVLADIFDAYALYKTDEKAREVFQANYSEMNAENEYFPETAATSLELKVLRFVTISSELNQFRAERQKAYAAVLRTAFAANIHSNDKLSFKSWLIAAGGIEEVRRPKSSASNSTAIDNARMYYNAAAKTANIAQSFAKQIKDATAKTDSDFVVALVRRSDKKIVEVCDNKAAVSATLKAIGKGITSEEAEQKAAAVRKQSAKSRKSATALPEAANDVASPELKKVANQ